MPIKKVVFLSAIALILLSVFLSQSRAPALDQKARMGLRTDISAIAFDTVFTVSREAPYLERVFKSAVNWSYTNWKGMTFGVLFGATLLTLMRSLPLWRLPANGFLAALQGLIGGAPLGVCVNCATPIAQGLHRAGIRLETMLAMLTASPTLNLIVITMMLSLFSWYFVLIKLVATILFIAVLIPLLVALWIRISPGSSSTIVNPVPYKSIPNAALATGVEWRSVLWQSLRELLQNLWFLVRITLPLMILAGILGALLVESVALETVANLEPGIPSYFLVAMIGVFLPVPIAFDVIITSALISIGLPVGLAMTLFFSLSIFSIFPAMIIARDISIKLSALLTLMIITFSILLGLITEQIDDRFVADQKSRIDEGLAALDSASVTPTTKPVMDQLAARIEAAQTQCAATFDDPSTCLNNLLKANAFGFIDQDLCDTLTPIAADLETVCRQQLKVSTQARDAINGGDMSLCSSTDCQTAYLNATSYLPNALGRCADLIDKSRTPLCRKVVLHNRITHFRSQAACESDLTATEQDYCQSEVQARIAMEQMDIEVCTRLKDPQAKLSCLAVVTQTKVIDAGDGFNCRDLPRLSATPYNLKARCEEIQQQHRALKTRDVNLCPENNPFELQNCRTEVIRLRLQDAFSRAPEMLVDASTGVLPDAEPHHLPESLPITTIVDRADLKVDMVQLVERKAATGQFLRHAGRDIGINHTWQINATDLYEPFLYGKGISSGDINRDGYPDLAVAFERGIYIYSNLGDGSFALSATLLPDSEFNAFVTALVDIDNDGWLDLFSSAYGGRQIFYLNQRGSFTNDTLVALGNPESTTLTMAAGFADLDQDGDLDVVLGKWAHGIERHFRSTGADNQLWLNNAGELTRTSFFDADPPGQTLSILLSDLNGDSIADIVTGNDRQVPDIFHFSTGKLSYQHPPAGTIPQTSLNTMSYESADFNNDLKADLFSSDMTFSGFGHEDYCTEIDHEATSSRCRQLIAISHEVDDYNVGWCNTLSNSARLECLAAAILEIAIRDDDPSLCARIPGNFPAKRSYCESTTAVIPPNRDVNLDKYPPQLTTNKFLMAWGDRFLDVTDDIGVARSNWSWNARAFDYDSDQFQDILVGTGYGFGASDNNDLTVDLQVFSNVLFHNERGASFTQSAQQAGLEDYANTSSYTLMDYDLDGDLDVVQYGQLVGISVRENRTSDLNNASFALRDEVGNSYCIGCKIIIETRSGKQVREIKASGGFLSFDEPVAHFGLAKDVEITGVTIAWSTGEISELNQPLKVNARYIITRKNP